MTNDLTELLLIAASRTPHRWLFGYQPDETVRVCWERILRLWPRELLGEFYGPLLPPMFKFPLDIAGWAENGLEPGEFHLLGKIGSELDKIYGREESARRLPEAVREFREQIQVARTFKRELEALPDLPPAQLADQFMEMLPQIEGEDERSHAKIAVAATPIGANAITSAVKAPNDVSRSKRGSHGLEHAELIYRLAKAQEAEEIKARSPHKTWKEIAKEINWQPTTPPSTSDFLKDHDSEARKFASDIKLLEDARNRLERVMKSGDEALLNEIAEFRKEKKTMR